MKETIKALEAMREKNRSVISCARNQHPAQVNLELADQCEVENIALDRAITYIRTMSEIEEAATEIRFNGPVIEQAKYLPGAWVSDHGIHDTLFDAFNWAVKKGECV